MVKVIALRQPVAADLRVLIAAMKIASTLERIGDLAKNIAKRAIPLSSAKPVKLTTSIVRMGRQTLTQLSDVLNAHASRDVDLAVQIWNQDYEIDELYNAIFREVVTYMVEDSRLIGVGAQLMFIAKNLERIGDHTTHDLGDGLLHRHRQAASGTTGPRASRTGSTSARNSGSRHGSRILVVEDEEPISQLLAYNLQKEGFAVATAADGEEALLAVEENRPDLVLLDWMLPNVSGIELCRQIRARPATRDIPVIMLTARGEEEDRVRGLDVGADDYVTKPFSMSELVARMRAVLRRTAPAIAGDVAVFADIVLDRQLCRVRRGKREMHLGPTEFRLLDALMQRPGRVYAREQLLDRVWGQDVYVEIRTVDVHIGRLRKALNRRGDRDPIRTVRSSGYALDETYAG